MIAPEIELPPECGFTQPFPLPDDVIAILDREFGERIRLSIPECVIQSRYFIDEYVVGPAVGDDMVLVDQ